MGSNGANEISKGGNMEGSEAPIEIKIKTLDSQTYTLQVNKRVTSFSFLFYFHEYRCDFQSIAYPHDFSLEVQCHHYI